MRTTLAILTVLSALSTTPILAAGKDKAAPNIQERLAQADLSVTLKQYEKVQKLAADSRLELALLAIRPDSATEKEREAIAKRIKILQDHAQELRDIASQYDKQIQEHRREIAVSKKQ